jgi:imidazolonepropionase-like amidohydrolase
MRMLRLVVLVLASTVSYGTATNGVLAQQPPTANARCDVAIVGATLIDGNGGPPVRDAVVLISGKRLTAVGPRSAVPMPTCGRTIDAGNIVGWGGNFSQTFARRDPETLFEEQLNDATTQGSGEELQSMSPDELRAAMNAYINKGVDFVKYGGTMHWGPPPHTLTFSERQARAIVEETHRHGKPAETHATSPEGMYIALTAGVDLVQHPEIMIDGPLSDELLRMLVDRKVICSMNTNSITGPTYQKALKQIEKDESEKAAAKTAQARSPERELPERAKTSRELYLEKYGTLAQFPPPLKVTRYWRKNAERIVKAGAVVSAATDNDMGSASELMRDPNAWRDREPGEGTLVSIEGLVELGLSPSAAIVAATKHGAMACRALNEFGTIETGKIADLLLLDADPLADIHNIRKLNTVIKDGQVLDREKLPTAPLFYGKKGTKVPPTQ